MIILDHHQKTNRRFAEDVCKNGYVIGNYPLL